MLYVPLPGAMVRHFCERALWLDHGQMIMDGPVDEVVDAYEGRRFPHRSHLID